MTLTTSLHVSHLFSVLQGVTCEHIGGHITDWKWPGLSVYLSSWVVTRELMGRLTYTTVLFGVSLWMVLMLTACQAEHADRTARGLVGVLMAWCWRTDDGYAAWAQRPNRQSLPTFFFSLASTRFVFISCHVASPDLANRGRQLWGVLARRVAQTRREHNKSSF